MRIKLIFLFTYIIILVFSGCKKDTNTLINDDFETNKIISNIKSFNVSAEYNKNTIPVGSNSDIQPTISIQQQQLKGEDILIKISVTPDAEELYFSVINPSEQDQNIAPGYYQIKLNGISNFETLQNGNRTYLVVLGTNETMQQNTFKLVISCKTNKEISKQTFVLINANNNDYYQKKLKLGFRPFPDCSYTIKITSPTGLLVAYSYDYQSKSEIFSNSLSPNATLTTDSELNIIWIDFSNPQFGNYTVTETIQGLSVASYIPLAINREGKIELISLDKNTNSTLDTAYYIFNYHQQNLKVNILAYQPEHFEMLNPTLNNCNKEAIDTISESEEESTGAGLRICQNCLPGYKFSKIKLEVFCKNYDTTKFHYFLKTTSNQLGKISVWNKKNSNDFIISTNNEIEINMPNIENSYSYRDIWITADSNSFTSAQIQFIVKDDIGNILSDDKVNFFPVLIKKVTLKGINTLSATHIDGDGAGHNWLTIQHTEINTDSSYGFWPVDRASLSSKGIVHKSAGGFDNPERDNYYDYSHTFYIKSDDVGKIKNYINYIISTKPDWNAPVLSNSYD